MGTALLEARSRFDADTLATWHLPCLDSDIDGERRSRQLAAMSTPFGAVARIEPVPQRGSVHIGQAVETVADGDDPDTITVSRAQLAEIVAEHLGDMSNAGSVPSVPVAEDAPSRSNDTFEVWNSELGDIETITLEETELLEESET